MGKFGKYTKHYKEAWEKDPILGKFISRAPEHLLAQGKPEAFCKICKTPLRAQKNDLLKHAETKAHKSIANSLNRRTQQSLEEYGLQPDAAKKKDDLKLSVFMAMHGSINSIDHLTETLKELSCGSNLDKIQLHRTKCSKLITNVVAPSLLTELIKDVGENPFSIILDESTDVTDVKYMAYCIRYFSVSLKSIVTDFLGFAEVERATAEDLHLNFIEFMKKVNLNLNKLVGLGTDGASNLCGVNKSLYTLLKKDYPGIQLFRCICHSLHLASSKACEELPSNLEVLIRDTRSWFSHSPLRKIQYKKIFQLINDEKSPPALVQLSTTRWLCWSGAVATNLEQWLELKTLFTMASNKTGPEKCYTARTLASMYADDINYLYLLFLNPILKQVADVNVAFQKSCADISVLYTDLKRLIVSLAKRFIKPCYLNQDNFDNGNCGSSASQLEIQLVQNAMDKIRKPFGSSLLAAGDIDFGDAFLTHASKKTVSADELASVKDRCLAFMVRLTNELLTRLPENLRILDHLLILSPKICLNGSTQLYKSLPWELTEPGTKKEVIESQCRLLQTLSISEIDINFKNISDVNIVTFWTSVLEMKNAQGDFIFKELAQLALRALSVPISNAVVERVFSMMALVKTKIRNRMSLPMLIALIRIRIHFSVQKKCCKNFKATPDMLQAFNSSMYESSESNSHFVEACEILGVCD